MGKSIYSLVLSDEVVEAVDGLAQSSGMSRSAMINRILAERVAFTTPEMRYSEILQSLSRRLANLGDSALLVSERLSGSTLYAKTSLKYPYKPTVKYSVEIFSKNGMRSGELRVSFRTQNDRLNTDLTEFFRHWAALEQKYISSAIHEDIVYRIKNGQFTRSLSCPNEQISDEEMGSLVAGYMTMFDGTMKAYFAELPDIEGAALAAGKYYLREISKQGAIV